MKTFTNIVCVVLLLGLLAYPKVEQYIPAMPSWCSSTVEMAKPDSTYGFDTSIPKVVKDKAYAHKLAGLFSGIADTIDHDGTRTKPEIQYVANVKDILTEAVNIEFDGQKLNKLSPGLGDAIGPTFEKEFPDGTAPLDPTARKKAADMYRALAYACALIK